MDRRWAQAIAEQWMGLAPGSVDVDPHRKSIRQARIVDGLAVLLPQAQEWAVVPSIKVGDPPGGSHWLDHEVLVLVEDGVYRVGGLEPDEEQTRDAGAARLCPRSQTGRQSGLQGSPRDTALSGGSWGYVAPASLALLG